MSGNKGKPSSTKSASGMTLRTTVMRGDGDIVRDIVASTGLFRPDEIGIAVELVAERLRVGLSSGYHFIFAEKKGAVLGYSCYGPVPLTLASYDLYWIAVRKGITGKRNRENAPGALRDGHRRAGRPKDIHRNVFEGVSICRPVDSTSDPDTTPKRRSGVLLPRRRQGHLREKPAAEMIFAPPISLGLAVPCKLHDPSPFVVIQAQFISLYRKR